MDLLDLLHSVRKKPWIGYTLALVSSLIGIGVRLALGANMPSAPFITFVPGIVLTCFVGGLRPGLFAALLSGLLAAHYLIAPRVGFSTWAGWVDMLGFTIAVGLLVALVDFAMRTSEQLAETSRALRALNEQLEERVAERTRDLTLLTARLREEIRSKEAAEERARQMQKIEAIGKLTGGIAHDFNNMLAIVVGSLDIAGRRLAQGRTDVLGLIDNAMDGAARAATLTRQLLAFSRQQPLAPVVVDVNALASKTAELLRHTLGEPVELECVLAGGLWRTLADPGQLEHAILNLAVNGRDAMQDGGRLTIETQNAHLDDAYAAANAEVPAGQYVMIAVTDTGTGMPADVVARAFDPFFTTKAEGLGTGLGLSQVYGFIKQSRGHIKIYSEIGLGTTVKVYLPRHMGSATPSDTFGEMRAGLPMPIGRSEDVILVVEDDDAVRRIHVGLLRELNYTVIHAASGLEALRVIRDGGPIALLFTDVVMPGMGGRKLAEEAKRLIPELKVLYTTGYTPNAIVHNGVVDQGVDLLTKPFAYDQLARKIRSVLDSL